MVPPFAGLVDLGWVRTLGPMGLASAIWYGGITILGTVVGAEWSRIMTIIAGVNRTLAIVAGAGAVVAVIWLWLARRRRKQERVWHATRDALARRLIAAMQGGESDPDRLVEDAIRYLTQHANGRPAADETASHG